MLYEQGRAHIEIGRHLPTSDPVRHEHLARAEEIFVQLGLPSDQTRVRAERDQA